MTPQKAWPELMQIEQLLRRDRFAEHKCLYELHATAWLVAQQRNDSHLLRKSARQMLFHLQKCTSSRVPEAKCIRKVWSWTAGNQGASAPPCSLSALLCRTRPCSPILDQQLHGGGKMASNERYCLGAPAHCFLVELCVAFAPTFRAAVIDLSPLAKNKNRAVKGLHLSVMSQRHPRRLLGG